MFLTKYKPTAVTLNVSSNVIGYYFHYVFKKSSSPEFIKFELRESILYRFSYKYEQ